MKAVPQKVYLLLARFGMHPSVKSILECTAPNSPSGKFPFLCLEVINVHASEKKKVNVMGISVSLQQKLIDVLSLM